MRYDSISMLSFAAGTSKHSGTQIQKPSSAGKKSCQWVWQGLKLQLNAPVDIQVVHLAGASLGALSTLFDYQMQNHASVWQFIRLATLPWEASLPVVSN